MHDCEFEFVNKSTLILIKNLKKLVLNILQKTGAKEFIGFV